jgi:hypothetical protein
MRTTPALLLAAAAAVLMLDSHAITAGRPQGPGGAAQPPAPVRVDPEEAAKMAREIRAKVSVEVPAGLELTLWASEKLLMGQRSLFGMTT